MSIKNSIDTIGDRTRDLPTCSAVPQLTALPCVPSIQGTPVNSTGLEVDSPNTDQVRMRNPGEFVEIFWRITRSVCKVRTRWGPKLLKNDFTTYFICKSLVYLLCSSGQIETWKVFNHLQSKRRLFYLKTQSVPRCKHFSSRL